MLTGVDFSDRGSNQQQTQQSYGFRLPNREQQQLQVIISQHAASKLKPEEAEKVLETKPKDFLDEFAQDECVFIVQARSGKPEKPEKPDQAKPGSVKPNAANDR
jgi:hypothetical protein